jgi:hypothetical protein
MTFVSKHTIRHATPGRISLHPELAEDSSVFFGLWQWKCRPEHGHSRSHQSYIVTTAGGVIFSNENHPELKVGQRIRYATSFDALGIEPLAVNVRPADDDKFAPIEWVGPHGDAEPVTVEAPVKAKAKASK